MKNSVYQNLNSVAEKNSVVVFGGQFDRAIPVAELSQSFDFNFKIYNRSVPSLSVVDAKNAFLSCVEPISPEGILIHIGENDEALFKSSPENFDSAYLDLISCIRKSNKKIRIALVSIYDFGGNSVFSEMNRHIKAIADAERCEFININNAKNWNPGATKEVTSFVYSLGFEEPLRIKKPLGDIAKILYSYAYENIYEQNQDNSCSA